MASSDDDEDLKRAIAMSLEEQQPSSETGGLDGGNSDDEDTRRAIALSLQDAKGKGLGESYDEEVFCSARLLCFVRSRLILLRRPNARVL